MKNTKEQQEICVKCQECCKWVTFTLSPSDGYRNKMRDYYSHRGFDVVSSVDRFMPVMIPSPCPHLTKDGCNVYENRPDYCKEYDGREDPFLRDKCKLPSWI